MDCENHAGVQAAGACSGCAESFCENCLVTIKNERYCGQCKGMAIPPSAGLPIQQECGEANDALKLAVVGIFCFGIILEPLALHKAIKAKRRMREDPTLTGHGKATAATVIACCALMLWAIGILSKFH